MLQKDYLVPLWLPTVCIPKSLFSDGLKRYRNGDEVYRSRGRKRGDYVRGETSWTKIIFFKVSVETILTISYYSQLNPTYIAFLLIFCKKSMQYDQGFTSVRENINSFRRFIETFSLFSNQSEALSMTSSMKSFVTLQSPRCLLKDSWLCSIEDNETPCVLIMCGSFNPVHNMHCRMLGARYFWCPVYVQLCTLP